MGTRCAIGAINPSGSVTAIFCAKDGEPSAAGRILKEHYSSPDSVRSLLALGPLESLGHSPEDVLTYAESARLAMENDLPETFRLLEEHCVTLNGRRDLHDPLQSDSPLDFIYRAKSAGLNHAYLYDGGKWTHILSPAVKANNE